MMLFAVFAVVFCQIVWGGYSVVGKLMSNHADPVVFAFWRDLIATPILVVAAGWLEGWPVAWPPQEDWLKFIMLGMLVFGNQLFYILGVSYTTPLNAALIQPSVPVLAMVIGVLLRLEKLQITTPSGVLKLLGLFGAVAGSLSVVVMTKKTTDDEARNLIIGNICLVTNCTCDAIYVLMQKRVVGKYPPVTTTAVAYLVSTLCIFLTIATDFSSHHQFQWSQFTMLALAYAVVLNSVLVYSLISWANKHTSPFLVTSFYPLQVVSSAVISTVVLESTLSLAEICGSLLVIISLFCVVAGQELEERSRIIKSMDLSEREYIKE